MVKWAKSLNLKTPFWLYSSTTLFERTVKIPSAEPHAYLRMPRSPFEINNNVILQYFVLDYSGRHGFYNIFLFCQVIEFFINNFTHPDISNSTMNILLLHYMYEIVNVHCLTWQFFKAWAHSQRLIIMLSVDVFMSNGILWINFKTTMNGATVPLPV